MTGHQGASATLPLRKLTLCVQEECSCRAKNKEAPQLPACKAEPGDDTQPKTSWSVCHKNLTFILYKIRTLRFF